MGGSSGYITANTEEELKKIAIEWYQARNEKWGMYPRSQKSDFPPRHNFPEDVEFIAVLDVEVPIQIILTTEITPDNSFYKHLKEKARQKQFACFVSAHT